MTESAPEVTRLVLGELDTNCYVLSPEGAGEAIVIDPADAASTILLHLAHTGRDLDAVLLTHAHEDHLQAAGDLQEASGAEVWVHEADIEEARLLCPGVRFAAYRPEGRLRAARIDLAILHTPGHTPGSVCIRWKDRLFSGDTLFHLGVGKCPDLNEIVRSIHDVLLTLPPDTTVHPGHGPETTIALERRSNPFVGVGARAAADSAPVHVAKTLNLTDETEFIEEWYTCGPFWPEGSAPLVRDWTADASATRTLRLLALRYITKAGPAGWKRRSLADTEMLSADPKTGKARPLPVRIIDFLAAYRDLAIDSSAYALALIECAEPTVRNILVGSDDGVSVWVNGERIVHSSRARPIVPDEDLGIARFRSGINVVLVESRNVQGYWGFMLRLQKKGEAVIEEAFPAEMFLE